MRKFLSIQLPVYYFTLALLIAILATYFLLKFDASINNKSEDISYAPQLTTSNPTIKQMDGFEFIAPLLYVDLPEKSNKFQNLSSAITTFIEEKKQSKQITDGSFYIMDLNSLEWSGFQENTKFLPGSLMKVPILLSYLKISEQKKFLLDQKLFYKEPYIMGLSPEILSKQIKPGNYYTIRELLKYMISYSDNNATVLLDSNLDQNVFNKVLTDLGLTKPVPGARNYPISAKEYTRFFRSIYNASFLSKENSEYAAEILNKTDFKNGFLKGFPPSVKMIHKFGESGNAQEHQLSESGIIYFNNKTYAITIMTKGKELQPLPIIIADMAGIVYKCCSAM